MPRSPSALPVKQASSRAGTVQMGKGAGGGRCGGMRARSDYPSRVASKSKRRDIRMLARAGGASFRGTPTREGAAPPPPSCGRCMRDGCGGEA